MENIKLNHTREKVVKRRKRKSNLKKSIPLYVLLLPAILILALFVYKPMYGIIIAFKDYSPALGIWNSPWVGLKHFKQFFNSFQFERTLKNTLSISVYSIFVGFPLPIMLALLTHQLRNGKFKKTFQVISYLPHFISTMIMCGMIIMFLSPRTGLITALFTFLGKSTPNILAMPRAFSSIVVWSDVWQNLGWDSIIYLAALSGIDPALYEAATIDGASKFQKIKNIDLPLLMPTTITLLILRTGGVLSVGFEKVFLLQNQMNLPVSEIISTYVYKMGMLNSQYSLSTAVGLFNSIVNVIILVVVNQIAKRFTKTGLF